MIARLDRAGLLPAIFFIFSRKGCDMAVQQCAMADLRLTTNEEAAEIAQALDEVAYRIPNEDLDVLEFWSWRDGLVRGFASTTPACCRSSRKLSRTCSPATWSR